MSKAPASKDGKTKKGKGGKKSNGLLAIVILLAVVPFMLPTLMVMFCALLPTLGAVLAERGRNRYGWICVGGMNFSGLAPWLFDLWFGHHTIDYAIHQITGVKMLLSSYSAAGVGWLVYLALPPLVSTLSALTAQRRSAALAADQKKLLETWGEEIARSGGDGS